MLAKYEFRRHHENSKVWFGRYLSPLNLSHWHEDAEILYCKEGEAEISVDAQRSVFKKAMLVTFLASRSIG